MEWWLVVLVWWWWVTVVRGTLPWSGYAFEKYKIYSVHRWASLNLRSSPAGTMGNQGGHDQSESYMDFQGRQPFLDSPPEPATMGEGRSDPFWHNLGLNSFQMDHGTESDYTAQWDVWMAMLGLQVLDKDDHTVLKSLKGLEALKRRNLEAFLTAQNARAFSHTPMHEDCWNKPYPESMYLPDKHVISVMHPWNEPWSVPCYSCQAPGTRDGMPAVFWAFHHQRRLYAPFSKPYGNRGWLPDIDTTRDRELDHDGSGYRNYALRVSRLSFLWAFHAQKWMPGGREDDGYGEDKVFGENGGELPQYSGQGRAFYFAQRMRRQAVGGTASAGLHYQEPDGRLVVDPNPGSGIIHDLSSIFDPHLDSENEETYLQWNAMTLFCTKSPERVKLPTPNDKPTIGNTLINVDSLVRPEWILDYENWRKMNEIGYDRDYPYKTYWSIENLEAPDRGAECSDSGQLEKLNLVLLAVWEPWGCCSACCCKSGRPYWECDRGPGACRRLTSFRRRRGYCSLKKLRTEAPIILPKELKLLDIPATPFVYEGFEGRSASGCDARCQWRALDGWLSTPPYRERGIPWFSTLLQDPSIRSVIKYFRKFLPAIKSLEEGRGLGLYTDFQNCEGLPQKRNCTLWANCHEQKRTGLRPDFPRKTRHHAFLRKQRAEEKKIEEELVDELAELRQEHFEESEEEILADEEEKESVESAGLSRSAVVATLAARKLDDQEDLRSSTNYTLNGTHLSLELAPGADIRIDLSGQLSNETFQSLTRMSWMQHNDYIPLGGHSVEGGETRIRRVYAERRRRGVLDKDGLVLRIRDVQAADTSHPWLAVAEMKREDGVLEDLERRSVSMSLRQAAVPLTHLIITGGVLGLAGLCLLLTALTAFRALRMRRLGAEKRRGMKAGKKVVKETFFGGQTKIRVRRNRHWRRIMWAMKEKQA